MAQALRERTSWYDVIYGGILCIGISEKVYEVFQAWTITVDEILLLSVAFGLLVYYWYFDSWNPGFRNEYRSYSLLLLFTAISTLVCFVGMFAVPHEPTKFIIFLEAMYIFDGWWAHEHGKVMEQKRARKRQRRQNSLIVISNGLTVITLILYSVFFYIADNVSSGFPKLYFTFVILITALANEVHYILIYRITK